MTTIGDYIIQTLSRFNLTVTADDITVAGFDPNALISAVDPKKVLVMIIPQLLLMPDITQGSTSVKYDRSALLKYYSWLCEQTGDEDTLTDKPKAKMYNDLW